MGRLATYVAKQLLDGNEVVVVNADKILVTGTKDYIMNEYFTRRKRGKIRKGPYYPRMPDRLFRRSVRGMIPYQVPRGRAAYKRLIAYIDVPDEFKGQEYVVVDNALDKGSRSKMSLGAISKNLGAKF